MANWKLFWVESNGYENCFIVAKNSRSAKEIEMHMNGFNILEVNAFRIMPIPEELELTAENKFKEWSKVNAPQQANHPNLHQWPWYADRWLLKELGATFRKVENKEQILLNEVVYSKKVAPAKE